MIYDMSARVASGSWLAKYNAAQIQDRAAMRSKIPVQCNVEFHTSTSPLFPDDRLLCCPTPQIPRCVL